MKLDNFFLMMHPKPPFWLAAWLFLFLIVNRKEGKQLIAELTAKMDEYVQIRKKEVERETRMKHKLIRRR